MLLLHLLSITHMRHIRECLHRVDILQHTDWAHLHERHLNSKADHSVIIHLMICNSNPKKPKKRFLMSDHKCRV